MKIQFVFRTVCALIIISVNMLVHQIVFAEDDANRWVTDMFDEEQPSDAVSDPLELEEAEQPLNSEDGLLQFGEQGGVSDHPLVLILKLIFYTALVIALIYLLVKFLNARQRKLQHHQVFQNLGGTPLGQNKSLQLVKVGGKVYLLGVGEQITLIKEIDDETQLQAILKDVEEQNSIRSLSWVDRLISSPKEQESSPAQPFKSLFQRSLERQKQRYERRAENNEHEEGRS